ncbi:aliphatic sulfonates ABC transporter ATP-binding protein [Acerihabitans arboris]|uniref:Aliphatic sulfonates ABC transporter ATP-binding protein n=1 Tax=Acerihabitans arboris TaxID=2691583 RepID=A0A845SJ34_9GAMM|nr:aliphatic sulfonates ABC transporter ATP-binding protein [Acerihabitans arboris]NDL63267.1 aliphatic sulfonates ABC transporter ATP-binding protein [Acerihabitans arboris]
MSLNVYPVNRGVALTVGQLDKSFNGRRVLGDIDLSIPAGQCVAIVGRSGCGKSTLLRLLAGLERPDRGQLTAGNGPLRDLRGEMRLMFQDARLLPWKKVLNNVGLGLNNGWRDAALAALATVGLADRADEWPAALSGGQKQRVALARALIHRPRLLLLDEPLGALDALTRIDMQRLIETLWQQQGFTLLLVTHDVHEAVTLADRVIVLENGHIGLDIAVDLPRPRRHGEARLAALERRILDRIFSSGDRGARDAAALRSGIN